MKFAHKRWELRLRLSHPGSSARSQKGPPSMGSMFLSLKMVSTRWDNVVGWLPWELWWRPSMWFLGQGTCSA